MSVDNHMSVGNPLIYTYRSLIYMQVNGGEEKFVSKND